jgi:hypothetical protein
MRRRDPDAGRSTVQRHGRCPRPLRAGSRSLIPDPRPVLDFASNHFELFGLPARYAIDAAALDAA